MNNKNTTNRTAGELTDLVIEIQTLNGNRAFAYAYATGTLIALLEGNRLYKDDVQTTINRQYAALEEDLNDLKKKKELEVSP
jgi:hypothetical protein